MTDMTIDGIDSPPLILLFSYDRHLAQTRHWVLEQSGFRIQTVHSLPALYSVTERKKIAAFLLCNSLSADLITEVVSSTRNRWPGVPILLFEPSSPLPELPIDEIMIAMEGPGKLVEKVRHLTQAIQT